MPSDHMQRLAAAVERSSVCVDTLAQRLGNEGYAAMAESMRGNATELREAFEAVKKGYRSGSLRRLVRHLSRETPPHATKT